MIKNVDSSTKQTEDLAKWRQVRLDNPLPRGKKRNANRFEKLDDTNSDVHDLTVHAQVEEAVSIALSNLKTQVKKQVAI